MPKIPPGGEDRRKSAKVKKAIPKRPAGRPSSFTPAITEEICRLLMEGRSLRTICKANGMPDAATVFRWLAVAENSLFREQYAQAREAQADTLVDEILDIADDSSKDYIQTEDGPKLNSEAVQRSRLRVDARKWFASKLAPKKYGDRQEIDHSGKLQHQNVHMTLAEFSQRLKEARA